MAGDPAQAEETPVRIAADLDRFRRRIESFRWGRPVALSLVTGTAGYVVAGPVGGVLGFVGGLAASRSSRALLLAAAAALYLTAAFTILEQPLTGWGIHAFPLNHPLADFSATIAAVLLLAGLVGMAAIRREGRFGNGGPPPPAAPVVPPPIAAGSTPRVPAGTVAALMGASLLAAIVLSQLGDRRWETAARVVAVAIVGLGVVLLLAQRLRSLQGRRLAPMQGSMTILNGLRREHSHLIGGSAWVLAGTLAVSIGSFVFWLLAAHRAPADEVGRAAALFSASLFVCYLTSLGLPIAVSRYASDDTRASATLFAWSLLLTIASSVVGVVLLVALAPASVREALHGVGPGLAWLIVLALIAAQSVAVLVDVRLMGLRRWRLVCLRSFLIAAIRLPFLFWVPTSGAAFYLFLVGLGGFGITGIAFLLPLARKGWLRLRPLPSRARRAAQFATVNYLGWLAVQAPFFAVPFVVLVQVGPTENARFYLSWGVMSVVYVSVQVIGQVLLVEGGRGGADHDRQAAVSLGAGLTVATVATLVSLGFGPLLADLYGPAYGPVATLLPLLVAGTIPFAFTTTRLTTARIREQSSSTIAMASGFAVAVLVPTVFLTARDGAIGAAWGWAVGNTIAAALALLGSRMISRTRNERALAQAGAPPHPPAAGSTRLGVSEAHGTSPEQRR
jgi:O-antigen/teichoic acid export membrane protein